MNTKPNVQLNDWLTEMTVKLDRKMRYAIERAQLLDGVPYTTCGENWLPGPHDGICWWTNGFWSGAMWQMYMMTGDEYYSAEARRAEALLDAAFADFSHLHHDVGFMWRLSSAVHADITGDEKSMNRAMLAATILAGRYNPLGFIRAWNADCFGWSIIDSMMNLSLLYWASEKSGDPRFKMIAMRHADTAMKHFVREDGSCNHIVIFDPETLEVKETPGGQGYASGSCWSRGLGWAMYGFMISYRYTGKTAYLDTARRAADYFIAHVGEDGIPASDFMAPAEPVRKDNIAGALAACALIDLARTLGGEAGTHYMRQAVRFLQAMESTDADWTLTCPAIFRRCRAAYHEKEHQTIQYGDYFFIEAVNKLRENPYIMW